MWQSADLHLHRTSIDADLQNLSPQGTSTDQCGAALAREIVKANQEFSKRSAGHFLGVHTVYFDVAFHAVQSFLLALVMILLSPVAELLSHLNKPSLTRWLRRQCATEIIYWSFPCLKCGVAVLIRSHSCAPTIRQPRLVLTRSPAEL
jgi:hypothetical protein